MFFKRKSCVIFRDYARFGYIIDGSAFGYKKLNDNNDYIGDKILSKSGSVFFSALERNPQSICDIAKKIKDKYVDVDVSTITNDAIEFYVMLERDGFVVSGRDFDDCEIKDRIFSYKVMPDKGILSGQSQVIDHPERNTLDFFEEQFGDNPRLTSLHVEITSKCNERCIHCYIPHEKKIVNMNPTLFYDILEQCIEMRVLHLTLSGGEPMLHKNFCDFLRKCREAEFSVSVLTNLTLLSDDIVKEMKRNCLLGIQTSLYSMDPDVHDGITKIKGSFEKTKEAILDLVYHDIPLQIACPVMNQNKDSYGEVLNWAEKHNVRVSSDYVIIAEYDHAAKNLSCRLSIDEVAAVIHDKSTNDPDYFKRMVSESEKKNQMSPDDHICSVCSSSICIAENGNVYPCAGWQGCVVGNVNECSIAEIWTSSKKVQHLRELRRRDFPKCIQCLDKDHCTMCMVRNANEHPEGDPMVVSEYFCKIANINKKILLEQKKEIMHS